jgi:phosphohistidine phosphatase
MKTLLLLRHAKSSRDDPSLPDFDRPLEQRGRRDAPRMGNLLKERGPLPDLIISSPAVRARETLEAFASSARLDLTFQFDESIYGATSAELLKVIRHINKKSSCVLLVGHNPGFEDLLSRLTGTHRNMPTAALACIEFQINKWDDIEDGKGKLLWLLTPKQDAN